MINISITGLLMGLVLMAIPIYVFYKYSIDWMRQAVTAFFKMILILFVTSLLMFYILKWNSPFVNVICVLLLSLLSTLVACSRANLKSERMIVPVLVGTTVAVFVVGAWTIVALAGFSALSEARFVIPIAGLLVGLTVESSAAALSAYNAGLRYHGQLFNFLLGNGASRKEALNYFVRRAMQKATTQELRHMAAIMLVTCPVAMYTMIMCGTDTFTAMFFQMFIMVAAVAQVVLAMLITLFVAQRYMLDDYARLKDSAE